MRNDIRSELLKAATQCPHVIKTNGVLLQVNAGQHGNALSQLSDRIESIVLPRIAEAEASIAALEAQNKALRAVSLEFFAALCKLDPVGSIKFAQSLATQSGAQHD